MYLLYFLSLGLLLQSSKANAGPVAESSASSRAGATLQVRQIPNKRYAGNGPGADALSRLYRKYGVPWENGPHGKRSNSSKGITGKVATSQDGAKLQFLAEVQYGTPPQTLVVNFDTGSSDNIVFTSDTPANQVAGQTVFDIAASRTARRVDGLSFNASFGDGSAALGTVLTDTVAIGGVSVTAVAVESMASASAEFTDNTDVDAIMGFAFGKLNQVRPTKQKTWFESAAPLLREQLFTANLKQDEPGTYNFGFVDAAEFTGELAFTPLNATSGFWQFRADGFAVDGGGAVSSPHDAFVDTGSSFMLLPTDIVQAYYAGVDGAESGDFGITVPCNATLPDFALVVAGVEAAVPGRFINTTIVTTADNLTCLAGIQFQPPGFVAVYGDNFMFAQFVVFDAGNSRIGFASKLG